MAVTNSPGPATSVPLTPASDIGTLSLAETARRLGISVTTAYDLVRRDEFPIPVRHIGNRMKVLKHDLERYLRGEIPDAS